MNSKNKNSKSGFTLVELLVAVAIFTTVATVAISSLLVVINSNRQSQGIKTAIDNISFAVDLIAREARSGINYNCISAAGVGPDCPLGGYEVSFQPVGSSALKYYRYQKDPSEGEGNIQECLDSSGTNGDFCSANSINWHSITAPSPIVNISNMNFYVLGEALSTDATDYHSRTVPRILITAEGTISSKNSTSTFNLQTTASERSRNDNRPFCQTCI